jgi:asparagine N-glycosylation enzyme membrane subunit Stt3
VIIHIKTGETNMARKLTIAFCRIGAAFCLALLLLAIFWPPKASGGMQFIPFMLAGVVYLFLCVPAKKLADTKYQKTALVLAGASLALYLTSIFSFLPIPFDWAS